MRRKLVPMGIALVSALGLGVVGWRAMAVSDEVASGMGAALTWQIETVDQGGDVGRYTSLALNPKDQPCISYHDASNGDMKVACHDGSEWQVETVEGEGTDDHYGEYSSLALDSTGLPHVSYYNAHDGFLQYAYSDGEAWTVESADWNGGQYTSLAMATDDTPHISHYDPSGHDLLYAFRYGKGWLREIVQANDDVGQYSSLALNGDDHPYISYYDATHGNLMVAYQEKGPAWITETVDADLGDVGPGTSLALDSSGLPHISYCDATNQDLKIAFYDGSDWQIETVDGKAADVGGHTSLVLDSQDHPHVAYTVRDSALPLSYGLKYAYYDGESWSKETVQGTGSVGLYPSLALDTAGWPHISYYDAGNGDLKYAAAQAPCPTPLSGVSIGGPSTVLSGTAAVFTATASPSSASLPITYLWRATGQSDVLQEEGSGQVTVDFTWDLPGEKTITVTATNCGPSAVEATHDITVEEPVPDLVITDIWNEGHTIWYQIMNTGTGAAPAGHHTSVRVDTLGGKDDYVGVGLGPGEWLSRQFSDGWACTPPQDAVQVCADSRGEVTEGSEVNNCREEVWLCDVTPPQITSGPTVSETTTTTAVVTWQTDEDSDSVVRYGKRAGLYDGQEQDSTLVQDHRVTLAGLAASTVYHYVVESSDGSGNAAVSKEGFFETASPPDGEPPLISSFQITQVGKGQYECTAQASDNVGVERVEFYLDDELIGVDYTPSSPYRVLLTPSRMSMSREAFYAPHVATAVAVDRDELADRVDNPFTPDHEDMDVSVVFRAPGADHTIFTQEAAVPPDTFVEIEVHAVQYVWECRYVRDASGGFEFCADRAQDVSQVDFYVDGELQHSSNFPETGHIHSYDWDAGGLSVGTQHTISVTAIASDGGRHHPTPPRTVNIVPAQPHIWARRTVSRVGNYFEVVLTVGNSGLGDAELTQIRDNLTGFQPISKTEGAEYTVGVTYDPDTLLSTATANFITGRELVPGESLEVVYLAVPILHPDLEDGAYAIGGQEVSLSYADSAGSQEEALDSPCQVTTEGELLAEAVGLAVREADYLIVTNPSYLFFFNANHDDVNALLSTMAHLAQLKAGVLGHLSEYDPDTGRSQIREWGSTMQEEDGTPEGYLSSGHLLIVGETEIVGSYTSIHKIDYLVYSKKRTVRWTDLPYGNTSGSVTRPELAVGRIIGNDAAKLMIPLQTSINVYLGKGGFEFDRSDALVVSGRGEGVEAFESNVDAVERILDDRGLFVAKLKQRDIENRGGNITTRFKIHDANKDVIYYRDHGGPTSWTGVITTGDFMPDDFRPETCTDTCPVFIDFSYSKPFVFACCCSAGRYEDPDGENGIAEAFSTHEAAVYIGSTEPSDREENNDACTSLMSRWSFGESSIGQQLKAVKRRREDFTGHVWAAEYNLYGDPKYGSANTVRPLSAAAPVTTTPPVSPTVVVPGYEVTSIAGKDYVEIPGGSTLLEPGEPMVPVYATDLTYPPGYRVQAVALLERSDLVTSTGLHIPTYTEACGDGLVDNARSAARGQETEWWPADVFDWQVSEMPDSSSILTIRTYPFRYNPLTTDAEFYQRYSFGIEWITSTVAIEDLAVDGHVYAQDDTVHADLHLRNAGPAQDLVVSAVVKDEASDEAADGMPLQMLHALAGDAYLTLHWDSTGFEPGYYALEVTIRDSEGHVLDRAMEQFRLGIYAGEIAKFSVTPATFETGDTIDVSLVFSNTGTVPITGTAVIQVQDGAGSIVEQFSHSLGDLAPGISLQFDGSWDTTGVGVGSYTVLGYVAYDSRVTKPHTVVVSSRIRVYLPLVLRD